MLNWQQRIGRSEEMTEDTKLILEIIVPIIIYIGNKKWNVKNCNCIKYTSFGENNLQLGYNVIDFNLYKTDELVNKKSKISKCIIVKKEIDMYLTRMQYNLQGSKKINIYK